MLKTPSKFRQRRGFAGGAMFKGSWGRCLLHTHQVHIFHLSIALKTRNCTNCAPVLCAICWTKGVLGSPNLCPANQKWGEQQGQACEPQPGTQPVPLTSSCEGRNWMGRYPVWHWDKGTCSVLKVPYMHQTAASSVGWAWPESYPCPRYFSLLQPWEISLWVAEPVFAMTTTVTHRCLKRLQEKVQAQSPLYKFTSTQSLLLFSWEKILNHGTSWAWEDLSFS